VDILPTYNVLLKTWSLTVEKYLLKKAHLAQVAVEIVVTEVEVVMVVDTEVVTEVEVAKAEDTKVVTEVEVVIHDHVKVLLEAAKDLPEVMVLNAEREDNFFIL
jgi:hypothetical protein